MFLIDLDTLSPILCEQDFARFAKVVFENKNMVKVKLNSMLLWMNMPFLGMLQVGCGLENDLRLLAKSGVAGLHSVADYRWHHSLTS